MQPLSTPPFSVYERLVAGFSVVGVVLAVVTILIVHSVMNGFREELLAKVTDDNGHVFAEALRFEDQIHLAILVLLVTVATLSLIAGLIMLRARESGRSS
ncbi:hypothetical protein [uncultured Enterovirga sp.]|uniref:hypothetical protein n=1 Tax=uncultured Enterovirga sp. TaxID=2026352 RepID=UPI0035CB5E2C